MSAETQPGIMPEARLLDAFRDVRRATRDLIRGLSPEDCQIQSMPDVSPTKWHLAHTTWFFETFLLEDQDGYRPFHPQFNHLFNSYYNSVGLQYSRPDRGLLSRPTLDDILAYREHVEQHIERYFGDGAMTPAQRSVIEIGIHHEQQHQELILMDILHVFSVNPLRPAYRDPTPSSGAEASAMRWHDYPGGTSRFGHQEESFAFDNEYPAHDVLTHPFQLGSRLITNADYLEFMRDGGYARHDVWLSDAWALLKEDNWQAPLYWEERDGEWFMMSLGGLVPVPLDAPVCHVSYYEADAFASWHGSRLPTEFEWELAARAERSQIKTGNFVESGWLRPAPLGASDAPGPQQLYGDVWEWTRSPYIAYPGFIANPGALGEYNGKFMSSQMVLRGGCCATPRSHIRPTYRNFFPPHSRWQFAGFRLARDLT